MIDIEKLTDKEYITSNFPEVYKMFKATEEAIEMLKTIAKVNEESFETDDMKVQYSTYNKFAAIDINKIIEKYPIEEHPEIYSISINKKASETIMEDGLLEQVPIKKVTIKFK